MHTLPSQGALPPWRARLHVSIFEADTPAGKAFDISLSVSIVLRVFGVMAESVGHIQQRSGNVFRASEWFFTGLFTVESMLRLLGVRRPLGYARSFFGLVDLLDSTERLLGYGDADNRRLRGHCPTDPCRASPGGSGDDPGVWDHCRPNRDRHRGPPAAQRTPRFDAGLCGRRARSRCRLLQGLWRKTVHNIPGQKQLPEGICTIPGAWSVLARRRRTVKESHR